MVTVAIKTVPDDAKIRQGDALLGQGAGDLSFARGEAPEVTVSRDGYTSRTIKLDASKPSVVVELTKKEAPRPAPRPPPPPTAPVSSAPAQPPKPQCPPGQIYAYGRCEAYN
jgi:hypothetical protein